MVNRDVFIANLNNLIDIFNEWILVTCHGIPSRTSYLKSATTRLEA